MGLVRVVVWKFRVLPERLVQIIPNSPATPLNERFVADIRRHVLNWRGASNLDVGLSLKHKSTENMVNELRIILNVTLRCQPVGLRPVGIRKRQALIQNAGKLLNTKPLNQFSDSHRFLLVKESPQRSCYELFKKYTLMPWKSSWKTPNFISSNFRQILISYLPTCDLLCVM